MRTKGSTIGPSLAAALEAAYPGDIWIQGVGGKYTAGLTPNLLPKGTNQASIDEAKGLFTMANTKCPDSTVVTGGYRFVARIPFPLTFNILH